MSGFSTKENVSRNHTFRVHVDKGDARADLAFVHVGKGDARADLALSVMMVQ